MTAFVILGMIGTWEAVLIIVAVLVIFGGRKIPELMRGLGQGMKEFKKATHEESETDKSKEVK